MNSTSTPVDGKPGVFNIKHEEKYEALGEIANAVEIKVYILDTDFETYTISVSCFGDGSTSHSKIACIDYKDKAPPINILEKATRAFKKIGWDTTTIKAVDQKNCPQ